MGLGGGGGRGCMGVGGLGAGGGGVGLYTGKGGWSKGVLEGNRFTSSLLSLLVLVPFSPTLFFWTGSLVFVVVVVVLFVCFLCFFLLSFCFLVAVYDRSHN